MQSTSVKNYTRFTRTKVTDGIVATLAFFNIYRLPLTARRIWELLYRTESTLAEVESELHRLQKLEILVERDGLYALENWDQAEYRRNQDEIAKRWNRVRRHYWLLSAIPFVEHLAVVNSMAMGNADSESDIDFFVVAKPNRLYFVRTFIILLFRLLGLYKSRGKVNERFCFGFYVTSDKLSIAQIMLPEEDPYLVFWLGTMVPLCGAGAYERFIKENRWVYAWLPNFRPAQRMEIANGLAHPSALKKLLEILCLLPAMVLEPLLRRVHIRHTFKLPENHWKTSSTVATRHMLKLHALDPRKDLRNSFNETLDKLK